MELLGILDRDTVTKACQWSSSRIEAVAEADGDLVELNSFSILFFLSSLLKL
jgi:hypothetical protein